VVRATAASRQWRHGKCPACWAARLRASAARRNSSEAQRTRACRAWASLGGTVLRGRWSEPGLILLRKKCHAINEGFHGHQSAPGTADTSVPMLLMNCAQQAKQEAVRLWEDARHCRSARERENRTREHRPDSLDDPTSILPISSNSAALAS
jgi:hypothetical protein